MNKYSVVAKVDYLTSLNIQWMIAENGVAVAVRRDPRKGQFIVVDSENEFRFNYILQYIQRLFFLALKMQLLGLDIFPRRWNSTR
jgi:hypothetical protein